ncbi:response regulator transcription factor [Acidipropionibacterium virtanenii]|uniref:Transcriptional regulatory protein DesR n=1 Tax=Acidipropionibacterium virtanenii TaxID=2057246 RepID=A0A344UQC6_9ACTN|nr:response regulator transcription factor [Acidipropionibacterium virtanenii]AXE37474.1 Transcriptional regulatory protein DesR [Acidipropionibacterium virtanenii]
MSGGVIRVGICDDSDVVRRQLGVYLSGASDLRVCGMYGSGADAIAGVSRDDIEVLLLDVRMPGMTGPAVASGLAASGSGCKILYVTSYPDEVPVRGALRQTVLGALTKDVSPQNMVAAVRLVASGVSLLAPEFIRQSAAGGQGLVDWLADPREREVLRLVQTGSTNAQIAEELNMSASWVKQTVSALCRRAGVRGRAGLAAYSGDAVVGHGDRD